LGDGFRTDVESERAFVVLDFVGAGAAKSAGLRR
jgi:hypothetical protein